MKIKSLGLVAAIGLLAACEDTGSTASMPSVGSDSNLMAFEGAKAGQAEMGIQNLGYELIRTEGLTAYWFNRSTGACAQIVTADGRYSSVKMLPSGDC
jgi:hypothetical protein